MTASYVASPTNRGRATKAEMMERHLALYNLCATHQPASVRHIFYQAVVAGVVGITKNDAGYNKVQRALVTLRQHGDLPYHWIVDNTRWMRRPSSYDDAMDCVERTAELYRRDLWSRRSEVVEVWAESDSIAGVIAEITTRWNVPLMVTRGFSSISFAHNAVEAWNLYGKNVVVYYIGDHDPSGLDIERKLLEYIVDWHPSVGVEWQRIGVTWEQAEHYDLPGTKPKRDYGFPLAVEAEALPPGILRDLLEDAIASHVDADELRVHEMIEAEERQLLRGLVGMLGGAE